MSSDVFGCGTVLQLELIIDLLGVDACSMDDFIGASDSARRYLRRKLLTLHSQRRVLGSKSLLYSLLPPDHNIKHLLTTLLIFSPVCVIIFV